MDDLDPELIKRMVKAKSDSADILKESTHGLPEPKKGTVDIIAGLATEGFSEPKHENRLLAFLKSSAGLIFLTFISTAIITGLSVWIVNINSVVKPITINTTKIGTLSDDVGTLSDDVGTLSDDVVNLNNKSIELAAEVKYLGNADKDLDNKTTELEKRLKDIEKPIEKLADDISDLKEVDAAIKTELDKIKNQP